jgi:hypothetical protein
MASSTGLPPVARVLPPEGTGSAVIAASVAEKNFNGSSEIR